MKSEMEWYNIPPPDLTGPKEISKKTENDLAHGNFLELRRLGNLKFNFRIPSFTFYAVRHQYYLIPFDYHLMTADQIDTVLKYFYGITISRRSRFEQGYPVGTILPTIFNKYFNMSQIYMMSKGNTIVVGKNDIKIHFSMEFIKSVDVQSSKRLIHKYNIPIIEEYTKANVMIQRDAEIMNKIMTGTYAEPKDPEILQYGIVLDDDEVDSDSD